MEEVKKAILQMEQNKTLGPDGVPAKFYQMFWEVIKDDLMPLFKGYHQQKFFVYSLDFGIITLLSKKGYVSRMQ